MDNDKNINIILLRISNLFWIPFVYFSIKTWPVHIEEIVQSVLYLIIGTLLCITANNKKCIIVASCAIGTWMLVFLISLYGEITLYFHIDSSVVVHNDRTLTYFLMCLFADSCTLLVPLWHLLQLKLPIVQKKYFINIILFTYIILCSISLFVWCYFDRDAPIRSSIRNGNQLRSKLEL